MKSSVGWLSIVGFSGVVAAANAQTPGTPSAAPVTKYDGTYAFVSGTNVNETYTTKGTEHIKRCGNYKGGPLTIEHGLTRYGGGPGFEGTVRSQGELAMRLAPTPANRGISPGVEVIINGRIDGNGAVRAHRMSYYCSYDLVWQKVSK